jgi:hypothetical protein
VSYSIGDQVDGHLLEPKLVTNHLFRELLFSKKAEVVLFIAEKDVLDLGLHTHHVFDFLERILKIELLIDGPQLALLDCIPVLHVFQLECN